MSAEDQLPEGAFSGAMVYWQNADGVWLMDGAIVDERRPLVAKLPGPFVVPEEIAGLLEVMRDDALLKRIKAETTNGEVE